VPIIVFLFLFLFLYPAVILVLVDLPRRVVPRVSINFFQLWTVRILVITPSKRVKKIVTSVVDADVDTADLRWGALRRREDTATTSMATSQYPKRRRVRRRPPGKDAEGRWTRSGTTRWTLFETVSTA
jgi:hypothetical protein